MPRAIVSRLPVVAADTGSGTLRYVAFGLPAGLSISTSTGTVSGTVAMATRRMGRQRPVAIRTLTVVANDGTYSPRRRSSGPSPAR